MNLSGSFRDSGKLLVAGLDDLLTQKDFFTEGEAKQLCCGPMAYLIPAMGLLAEGAQHVHSLRTKSDN
jgi:hypothetical protein